MVEDLSKIPTSDLYIVTAYPTADEFYHLYKNKKKVIYFIQDFENWNVSDAEVLNSYHFPFEKIVIAQWLLDKVTGVGEKASFIPNGVDASIFKAQVPIENRPQHSLAMLYHTQARKGTDEGMKAIYELKKKYPDLHVNLFGSPQKPNRLPNWIEYHKNIKPLSLAKLYNNSSVFLCPSKVEGFGLTGLESSMCGCLLVSTPTQGVFEYADNESSIILDGFTYDQMVDGICEVFDDDKKRLRLVGNALKRVNKYSDEFSREKFTNVCVRLLDDNE